jgi:hypothetical protein
MQTDSGETLQSLQTKFSVEHLSQSRGRYSPRRQSEQKYCEGQRSRQYIQCTLSTAESKQHSLIIAQEQEGSHHSPPAPVAPTTAALRHLLRGLAPQHALHFAGISRCVCAHKRPSSDQRFIPPFVMARGSPDFDDSDTDDSGALPLF